MISDKWKVLILRDLLDGTKRFSELRRSVGSVSQKVLTANLRQMERDGLVHRRGVPGSAAARGVFADGDRADAAAGHRGDEKLGYPVQGRTRRLARLGAYPFRQSRHADLCHR